MKKLATLLSILFLFLLVSCNEEIKTPDISTQEAISNTSQDEKNMLWETVVDTTDLTFTQLNNIYTFITQSWEVVEINPITHATMVINWGDRTLYIDPAETIEAYATYDAPSMVLVTHEHGDHFNLEVLEALVTQWVELVVNDGVFQLLTPSLQEKATILANGDMESFLWFEIEAVPAYNIREEALNYHPKWRDNGYVIESDSFRVYISWDTEDTPEMRALQDIDVAFVSMNLPYTMPIESAVWGIAAFGPKVVFPYHFRGEDGMSDIESFREQVLSINSKKIDVVLAEWY